MVGARAWPEGLVAPLQEALTASQEACQRQTGMLAGSGVQAVQQAGSECGLFGRSASSHHYLRASPP